jgi:hypothetical protein|eukprot:TRINITY_DN62264_c0_g1_i1.p1 TRINITY_DN62264_c0_g1~~TRINITY_DN62264_c0_g1_i1.p1  ORF type:complete len:278 (+),score=37.45 TRINITY_DN62264_c0_g1_i1:133-966(+)
MSFVEKVVGAATQGAVGAVVGASLSAVTEPVVNKVLVERKTLAKALSEHSLQQIIRFFQTTLSTNFIKFPFFEVVNMLMNSVTVPPSVRGTVTGLVFTSATLPITNYRFKKSMNLPLGGAAGLYQAYLPTVGRDIIYGVARNSVTAGMMASNPGIMKTNLGRFRAMFFTVLFSCVASAPGNELRGFVLQPKGREKPFSEFFDPMKTIRSTIMGGLIMSFSLATGVACTPFAESLFTKLKTLFRNQPFALVVLMIAVLDKMYWNQRWERVESKLKNGV